ncbi:ribonuclease Z [Rhabdothermincola sediminis]|uniref:ribonuclease Z n=1 Tax=Rhabdothermincola sediminis TaxID=2751370 RepID=UPI001AA05FB6|nr:ribonuclease Z [Rhabdothermincola sediminis]
MSGRDLVVLGTASQVPTRSRNHNGYLLRWDREAILFDPGEGTQRQLTFAGVSAGRINRICLTHLHGDHCLGLPGILQRLALDASADEIPIHFPASGAPYVERLCDASIGRRQAVRLDPVPVTGGLVEEGPPLRITALPLDHRVDTLGWRLEEPASRHFLRSELEALGLAGPAVGELERRGWVEHGGRRINVEDVSEIRRGMAVAVVMDTRACDNAVALAERADLLLCEATFLESEVDLAVGYGHLTAREAATIAREAGVGQLVLTHLSSRYPSAEGHLREAAEVFPDVVVAEDLTIIDIARAPEG